MWADPNLFKKRKPISLGGTPANKFSAILCLTAVVTFSIVLNALSYTPYMKKKIANVEKTVAQGQENQKFKAFLADPLVKGAIERKKLEYEEEPKPLGWF